MSSEKMNKISLEVFPPKKDDEFENLYTVLDKMAALNPESISVTYGAGGSRSKKTVEVASYIEDKLKIRAIAHLTCVGNKKADIDRVLDEMDEAGIKNILALRGDRPTWMSDEEFFGRDFEHASDLITYIKSKNPDIHISGACYPEKHYEASDLISDIRNLKLKVDAGAEDLISQLFFDNRVFYEFLDKARAAGINIPIYAGIMPITSKKQIESSISLSGSSVPKALADLIAKYGDNPEDMRKAGIDYAVNQIQNLLDNDVDGVHIYSMNKPVTTAEIVNML